MFLLGAGIVLLVFSVFMFAALLLGLRILPTPELHACVTLLLGVVLVWVSWLVSKGTHWKWISLSLLGIALLAFSTYIFAVLHFGPSWPPNYSKQTPILIGVFSLALGAALIAMALLKGRSS